MTRFAPFLLLTALGGCLDTNVHGGDNGTGTSGTAATTTGSGSGSTGSSSGGSTASGTTTGASISLDTMCNDFVVGADHVDQCTGSTGPVGTVQQCEAVFAVCTAQDDQILDGIAQCFEGVPCNSTNLEAKLLLCGASLSELSGACFAAGADAGGRPPPP